MTHRQINLLWSTSRYRGGRYCRCGRYCRSFNPYTGYWSIDVDESILVIQIGEKKWRVVPLTSLRRGQ